MVTHTVSTSYYPIYSQPPTGYVVSYLMTTNEAMSVSFKPESIPPDYQPKIGDVVFFTLEIQQGGPPLAPRKFAREPWRVIAITPGANNSEWIIVAPLDLNHRAIHFAGKDWLRYDVFLTETRRAIENAENPA